MNIAQLEYADIYSDPLPSDETLDKLKELCRQHSGTEILVRNKKEVLQYYEKRWPPPSAEQRASVLNQLTQGALRLAELKRELLEVAEQFVSESRAGEFVTA